MTKTVLTKWSRWAAGVQLEGRDFTASEPEYAIAIAAFYAGHESATQPVQQPNREALAEVIERDLVNSGWAEEPVIKRHWVTKWANIAADAILAALPIPATGEVTLDRDDVAKVLCRLESRRTGRSFEEVVAPGIELWTRHRYEAEQLIDELQPLLTAPSSIEPEPTYELFPGTREALDALTIHPEVTP